MAKQKISWEEFVDLLRKCQLTRAQFCELSGVAYATTNGWQQRANSVPAWVSWALENYRAAQQAAALRELLGK